MWDVSQMRRKLLFLFLGLAMLTCVIAPSLAKRMPALNLAGRIPAQSSRRVFWLGALFLAVLTGALIPSAVVAASAQEFVSIIGFYHPLWYITRAFFLSASMFLIWMGVFYWLADSHWRILFQRLVLYSVWCGIRRKLPLDFVTVDSALQGIRYTATPFCSNYKGFLP